MALEKFNWQNGTQIEPAKVEIGGQSYSVSDAQYEGETPLSAANLNLMQDTILGNVKDNLDDGTKIPSVKAVKGKILWTNQSPTSSFAPQTITLDESLDNYDCYVIIFKQAMTGDRLYNTGQIPVGHGTICYYNAGGYYWYRPTSDIVSGNTITFEDARVVPIYQGSEAVDNSRVIPIYVIGYNTGLF